MPSIHYFQNTDSIKGKFSYKPVLYGVSCSIICSIALIFVSALILLYANISQQTIPYISKAILFLAVIFGGIISGIKSRINGWLYGALTGCCFYCLLFLLGSIIGADVQLTSTLIVLFIICILFGSTGGVLGVNLKLKRKKIKH